MNIFSRIQELADIKRVTMYAVSQDTGISQSVFSRLKNEPTTKLNRKNLEILANYFCVNPKWLATGVGDRYEPGIVKDTLIHDDALCERLEILGIKLFAPQNNKSMYGIDYHEFGRQTDIPEERLYQIIRDEKFPTYTEVLKIVNSRDININAEWLFTGKGLMLKSENSPTTAQTSNDRKGIPYYADLPVSAGQLETFMQDAEPTGWVNLPGVNPKALFPVIGCSMKPEINPGDVVGIVQINSWEVVDPDKTYLIITHDERMIKHLAIDESDDSILWCISPNYPKFKINKEDIKYLYRISFCGKLM